MNITGRLLFHFLVYYFTDLLRNQRWLVTPYNLMLFFLLCLEMLNYVGLENITITIPALRSVYRVIEI